MYKDVLSQKTFHTFLVLSSLAVWNCCHQPFHYITGFSSKTYTPLQWVTQHILLLGLTGSQHKQWNTSIPCLYHTENTICSTSRPRLLVHYWDKPSVLARHSACGSRTDSQWLCRTDRQTTLRFFGWQCCSEGGISCSIQEYQHWSEAHVLGQQLICWKQ